MNEEHGTSVEREPLPEKQAVLLRRARQTLEANIADPRVRESGALPWSPLRGIVPAIGAYDGIWNWDAAFHALAVSRWNSELAREQIRILLNAQLESGALPDVIFCDGRVVTNFGKPPVAPWVVMHIDRREPDDGFLSSAYEAFVRYEDFWMRERGGAEEGLFHYDSAAGDPQTRHTEAKFESGWDDSVRFDEESYGLWPIDLNCYMVMLYDALGYCADRLRRSSEIGVWQERSGSLSMRVNERLWDAERGRYSDRLRTDGRYSPVVSPAAFMPLFAGIADGAKADRMAELAASPDHFFPGMPTVAYNDPGYTSDGYWRGPTWLNAAYFALRGLKEYGHDEIAGKCRETILDWCSRQEDSIYEYYDSMSGKGCGAAGFGWSAAFLIELTVNW